MPFFGNTSQLGRPGIRLVPGVFMVLAGMGTRLAAAPPALAPEWSWEPSQGVEWIEQAYPGAPELLADARDGELHVLSLDSGKELLARPLPTRPGLRPVSATAMASGRARRSTSLGPSDPPAPAEMAYCFDRFTVLAIRLSPRPGLAWRVGTWREGLAEPTPPGADPAKTFQGDPEELRQLLAASATALGILVVRDDGHFGLLGRGDGHVIWERSVGRMALARLHVRGDEAALIWRSGPEVQAASIDVRTGQMREYPLLPERPWPFWSDLTGGGLVLIEPERCIFTSQRCAQTVFRTRTGANIISASVALRPGCGPAAESAGALLVFGTGDGVLHAINPQDGAERWACVDLESRSEPWAWVKLLDDLVVSAAGGSAHIRAAATGQLLAKYDARTGARLLDASVAAGRVQILVEHAAGEGARFELVGVRWRGPGATAQISLSGLGRTGVFLNALWAERRLVVSTRRGAFAFVN